MRHKEGVLPWILEHFYGAFDIPYVPQAILELPRPILLHISDTPSHTYPYVLRLIRKLAPEYFVHTGDIADELKLEKNRSHIFEYSQKVTKFIQKVEETEAGEIVYVIGNHDDAATVREVSCRSRTVIPPALFDFNGIGFYLIHQCSDPDRVGGEHSFDFALFGHNTETETRAQTPVYFLNGIFHIHVISLKTKEIHMLPYPAGTESARKLLPPKIGM